MEAKTSTAPPSVQRLVGVGLVLYAVGVAVQVAARAASNDSQPVFTDSLAAIAENSSLYLTSMYAGIASNILLATVAGGVYSVFASNHPALARSAAFLMLTTAVVSLVSGAAGLALASLAQEFAGAAGGQAASLASSGQSVELVREYTGRVGFTLAGLSVVTLGILIAWRNPLPRWLGWLGILVGLLMFFIWSDSAALLHRIGGAGYLLWLIVTGGWLALKGTREPTPS